MRYDHLTKVKYLILELSSKITYLHGKAVVADLKFAVAVGDLKCSRSTSSGGTLRKKTAARDSQLKPQPTREHRRT